MSSLTPTDTLSHDKFDWPDVRKTMVMRAIERDHGGRDIRDVLIDAIVASPTEKQAADLLDIDNSTLSTWISKLRINERIDAIRAER